MAFSRNVSSSTGYNNYRMFEKFIEIVMNNTSDIQFTFNEGNEDIKLPAHKKVLAASSPVFNAMFFGELAEKDEVTITDASPTAFKEFLQFFYEQKLNLSMENIAEVMQLIDKYDVAQCFPICVDFLKDQLRAEDIIFVLNLAKKYKLGDLEGFCSNKIETNFEHYWNMFDFKDGKANLLTNSTERMDSHEVGEVLQHIFMLSKKVLSKQSEKVSHLKKLLDFFPIYLSTSSYNFRIPIKPSEIIHFSMDKSMLLTHIVLSKVFIKDGTVGTQLPYVCKMSISEVHDTESLNSTVLYTRKIDNQNEEIDFPDRILFKQNKTYAITFDGIKKNGHDLYTFCSSPFSYSTETINVAPGVNIRFPRKDCYSLISQMHFAFLVDD